MTQNLGSSESCTLCGESPAERIKLQSASSRIIWWNHQKIDVPLCATCAEVVYYQMQTKTLIQGWWGPISAAATIFFSLANLSRINAHRNLLTYVKNGKDMIPRPTMKARSNPAAVVMSIVAILIIGSIASALLSAPTPVDSSVPTSYVGSCWSEEPGTNKLSQVNCSAGDAKYEISLVTTNSYDCSSGYINIDSEFGCLRQRY